MSLLVSLLAAVVVFIAGWAVIKRYPTVIVLFAAGLILVSLLCSGLILFFLKMLKLLD